VIEAAAVTIPARNEEALLPSCLAALRRAAAALAPMPVHTVVVADACTDRTIRFAQEVGASVVEISARNVGAARAAGMGEALRRLPRLDPARIWLATTDADTLVPACWLSRQIQYAHRDWDVILGTVTVSDWKGRPAGLAGAFARHYRHGARTHHHVHGANLGLRASAYLAAGGFQALRTAEDHALLNALGAAGCAILPVTDIAVETSARRGSRAPHGFSHLLDRLSVRARLQDRAVPGESGGFGRDSSWQVPGPPSPAVSPCCPGAAGASPGPGAHVLGTGCGGQGRQGTWGEQGGKG
jgi:glycosyltransferase involved in cell wall biosynthesis